MTAIFNFQSLLLVILLVICTGTYIEQVFHKFLENRKNNMFFDILYKASRIGTRLSPYMTICCTLMAFSLILGW